MKATSHIYDTEVNTTILYFIHFLHSVYILWTNLWDTNPSDSLTQQQFINNINGIIKQ